METAVKGRIDDISVTAVGACEDEANFRITFGPTATSDLENVVFNSLTLNDEQKDLLSQNHFTADIDVFEKNFSFRGMTLASWSRTSWALVESVLDEVEQGMAAD